MSEFTSGHILRAEDRDIVRKYAVEGSVIMQLNEQFIAYLTSDVYNQLPVPEHIQQLSQEAPVLYFYNFEDHEWGYRLIYRETETAKLHIAYEYEEEIISKTAMGRYPEKSFRELLFGGTLQKIREELEAGSLFEEKLEELFDDSRPEEFQLLGASGTQIEKLREILNINFINHDINEGMELSDEFKQALGIEEMSFIRHEHIVESKRYDEIF
ncbi:hypothetical protein [Paenibacillus ihuae]|uniref:hypothetical protein n=1 Tax=Paenibacillus ihuae TaxID=1232431 RepID=UPI0006D56102|nr:hypothetical protein [Paenibacillus ihuae]